MNSRRNGFTLIELIVALGITAVIGYFFVSIGRDFVAVWDNVGDSVARETEARAALDVIARDFESAFLREGTDVMFAATVLTNSSNAGSKWESSAASRPAGTGYDPENHQYGWAGCWVRMISAAPSLNAVGYQVIRSTIHADFGDPRYMLYRNVAQVEDTINNEFDLTSTPYVSAGAVVLPSRDNIMAVNVVDFGVRLYIYDSSVDDPSDVDAPDGLRLIFPADGASRLATTYSEGSGDHSASTFTGAYGARYPDVVEVFIRLLSEDGADELFEMEDRGDNVRWYKVVEENSKLYRRFIVVRGKGGV